MDPIDRQAAIDALCSVCGADCDKSKFVYGGKQEDQVILCPEHYVLTQLPSTQPEIIYCGECKHMMPDGRCREFADSSIHPSASDFCSAAERKIDETD